MGLGGFSWKRATGISSAKSKISKSIGIPLTKSGRQRKVGKLVEDVISEPATTLLRQVARSSKSKADQSVKATYDVESGTCGSYETDEPVHLPLSIRLYCLSGAFFAFLLSLLPVILWGFMLYLAFRFLF